MYIIFIIEHLNVKMEQSYRHNFLAHHSHSVALQNHFSFPHLKNDLSFPSQPPEIYSDKQIYLTDGHKSKLNHLYKYIYIFNAAHKFTNSIMFIHSKYTNHVKFYEYIKPKKKTER